MNELLRAIQNAGDDKDTHVASINARSAGLKDLFDQQARALREQTDKSRRVEEAAGKEKYIDRKKQDAQDKLDDSESQERVCEDALSKCKLSVQEKSKQLKASTIGTRRCGALYGTYPSCCVKRP